MSPLLYFKIKHENKRRRGLAVLFASMLFLSLISIGQINSQGLKAYAQTEPIIKIDGGFATFSYGLLSVSVTVENTIPDIDTINIKYYNPDGDLLAEEDQKLSVSNGTGYFHCYCFGVERKYVEENYRIVVTYGEKMQAFLVPPYSSQFPQPPDISLEDLRIDSDGKVYTSGRVWGGIGGENLTVSVYSSNSDQPLGSTTAELGLHVQFSGTVDTSGQLQAGSSYRIVYRLEGTDITKERTFTFTGTDQALLRIATEANAGSAGYKVVEVQVNLLDQDGNKLQSELSSPAEFLVTIGQKYIVQVTDSDEYLFSNWGDTGSTDRARTVSIDYSVYLYANYRNASEPEDPDFSIAVSPTSLTITPGSMVHADLAISSINGFSSSISIEVYIGASTSQISGYSYTSDLVLPADNSAHADISVTANENAVPGSYVAQVTTKSGSIIHYLSIPIEIIARQTPKHSSVTIQSVDVANGNIEIFGYYTTLSQNGQVVKTGFTPTTFELTSGETYEILVYDYSPYFFNYWVDNASHARERTIAATYDGEIVLTAGYGTSPPSEQDFTISADPPSLNMQAGTSDTSLIIVTSVNDLNSEVALSLSSETSGITGSFDKNQVIPYPNESESSALTLRVDSDVPAGSYDLLVTGTTATGISHSTTVTVTVDQDQQSSEESSVTIKSISSETDNEIYGYYTLLFDASGDVVNTGFTPATFQTTVGQIYTIEVQDYGSYYFNHWSDNGSTNRDRAFTAASSAQTFTAVYSTSPLSSGDSSSGNSDGGSSGGSSSSSGTISVTTTDSSGNTIAGYYTTLWQNGAQIDSAFSPASFTVTGGQSYQVAVSDYGSYSFDHWSDGSYDRLHNAQAGDSLTAVYRQ